MNVRKKWRQSEVCVVISDKSQASVAEHSSWDGSLYYKFVIQFAGGRTFKIGEHLTKLQAKWLIVSHAALALRRCPQRCRTRQICTTTNSVLRTEAATD